MGNKKHMIIIGGGVGGYTAALEVCKKGLEVTLIEQDKWGGTCLQRGCVPMKFLLEKVHKKETPQLADWQQEKQDLIKELAYGLQYRLEKAKMHLLQGCAKVIRADNEVEVEVTAQDGSKQMINGDYLLLATGAHTVIPDVLKPYQSQLWDVTDVMNTEELPKQVVIIGAGVSGVECAEYLASLGVQVQVVERCEQILPGWDMDISEEVSEYFEDELEIQWHTGYNVCHIELVDLGYQLILENESGEHIPVEGEKILVCTGKAGNVTGMGLEELGILDESGKKIVVNEAQQTVHPKIYAVGDCTLTSMTAHGAAWEAKQAVRHIFGENVWERHSVSAFLSTNPPACRAGMTADEAEDAGWEAVEGVTPLYGNGKAAILQQTQGLIKVVADQVTGQILGFHMYGPYAEELLSLGSFIVEQKSTVEQVKAMAFPHPTVGEYLQEAVNKL